MAFDSVTSLLFNIGANSDDAEENIARFRALMGTDLEAIGAQFESWADDVFGKLDSVKGALIGVTAGVAAMGAAAAAFAYEATDHFEEYAIAVDNASKKTGISVEDMSKLHFAAGEIGVSFDSLVMGLVRLSRSMLAASQGSEMQSAAFAKLGLTQKDLTEGQQNMMPLIEKIADRYSKMSDGAVKAAVSQELFSRGGSELIRFLNMGSAGIEELAKHAEELGLVLNDKDVRAARELQAGIKAMHAEQEALDKYIAEQTLPLWTSWKALEIGFLNALKDAASGQGLGNFGAQIAAEFAIARAEIQKTMELATKAGGDDHPLFDPKKTKEAASDFKSLTSELDGMKLRLAELDGPEAKVAAEMDQMRDRAAAATTELIKLRDEGKLAPGVWERESQALIALRKAMGEWQEAMGKQFADRDVQEIQKYIDKIAGAGQEIQDKISEQEGEGGFAKQEAQWAAYIDQLRAHMQQEGTLTAENQAMLVQLRVTGEARIALAQDSAFAQELAKIQEHNDKLSEMEMTRQQKLAADYQRDLARFSDAEEHKALLTAASEEERAVIEQRYATVRAQLQLSYQRDLQALENSQGWQGVFGNKFAQMIKQNEQLSRDWATSSDQSAMLVKVAVESLGEMGQQSFEKLAEGMGGGIANALVYSKSIGQAMRAATAATLESIAAQAMTQAIYSLAWGFLDLAQGNYAAADAAFEAAALFGAVGVAAGVAGRAVAPASGGGSGGGARGGGSSGGYSGGPGRIGGGSGAESPMASSTVGGVSVHVYGHVVGASGIEQIASMINDAVQNRDVRLVATQVRQTTPATF
ncbi:MAG: hypothetical protein KGL39_11520 [Patescibacteria group bacterium]|nr:hypothetical protein [Patescibacteria group bacterium]